MGFRAAPVNDPFYDPDFVTDFSEVPGHDDPVNTYVSNAQHNSHAPSAPRYTTLPLPQNKDTVKELWLTKFNPRDKYKKFGCTVIAGNLWSYMTWDMVSCGNSTRGRAPPEDTFHDGAWPPTFNDWERIMRKACRGELVSYTSP